MAAHLRQRGVVGRFTIMIWPRSGRLLPGQTIVLGGVVGSRTTAVVGNQRPQGCEGTTGCDRAAGVPDRRDDAQAGDPADLRRRCERRRPDLRVIAVQPEGSAEAALQALVTAEPGCALGLASLAWAQPELAVALYQLIDELDGLASLEQFRADRNIFLIHSSART